MNKLLFIDTNIYLDFYRINNKVKMAFLRHIDSVKDCVIMTDQVEMEFKKNRQSVIVDTLKNIKAPAVIPRPGLLSDDKTYLALSKDICNASKRVDILQNRLQKIFENPCKYDPIFKVVNDLSSKQDSITLQCNTDVARNIRRRAIKRFLLGYPPRKQGDLSTGDAVNWEWLIECATSKKPEEILIVSRDADYGMINKDLSYLNDWLVQEFNERVGKKTKMKLYVQMSLALKELNIDVSELEQKTERQLIVKKDVNQLDFIKRISMLDKNNAKNVIELALSDAVYGLVDEEAVSGEIANTNAFGWVTDDYNIESYEVNKNYISVRIKFSCSGDQDEDKMFYGNHIDGEATVIIDNNCNVTFREIEARIRDISK